MISNKSNFCRSKSFACSASAARRAVAWNVVAGACEQVLRHPLLIIRHGEMENITSFRKKFIFSYKIAGRPPLSCFSMLQGRGKSVSRNTPTPSCGSDLPSSPRRLRCRHTACRNRADAAPFDARPLAASAHTSRRQARAVHRNSHCNARVPRRLPRKGMKKFLLQAFHYQIKST